MRHVTLTSQISPVRHVCWNVSLYYMLAPPTVGRVFRVSFCLSNVLPESEWMLFSLWTAKNDTKINWKQTNERICMFSHIFFAPSETETFFAHAFFAAAYATRFSHVESTWWFNQRTNYWTTSMRKSFNLEYISFELITAFHSIALNKSPQVGSGGFLCWSLCDTLQDVQFEVHLENISGR